MIGAGAAFLTTAFTAGLDFALVFATTFAAGFGAGLAGLLTFAAGLTVLAGSAFFTTGLDVFAALAGADFLTAGLAAAFSAFFGSCFFVFFPTDSILLMSFKIIG